MDFWGGQSTKTTLDGEMTDLQAQGPRAEMLLSVLPTQPATAACTHPRAESRSSGVISPIRLHLVPKPGLSAHLGCLP